MPRKIDYILISLLTLFTFLALFIFRTMDDNRLTSWQWIFDGVNAANVFFILVIGVILAFIFSRVSFPIHNPAIFLFLSSFIIAAFFWRVPEVIVDASRYFTQAKHLEVYGIGYFFKEWGKNIMSWTDLPLVPFLYGLVFKFLGESRLYIQIFTTFLFSMTVVLTYLIGKTLWDENTGFFAGLLLIGIPYIFTQVPLMLVDIPTMFFLILSIYVFIKAMDKGGVGVMMLSSITIFLAFFSKYSTWLMLSVLVIIFLVYRISTPHTSNSKLSHLRVAGGDRPPNYIYRGSIISLITALLIGIVFFDKFDVFSEQIKLLISYQKPGLRQWGESFASTFFSRYIP